MMPSGDDDTEPITAHVALVSKEEYERLEAELHKQDQELQAPVTNADAVDDEAPTESEAEPPKGQRRRWTIVIVVALVGVSVVIGVVFGVAFPKKQTQSDASSVTTGAPPTPALPPLQFPTSSTPSASLIELLSSVSLDGGVALQTPSEPQNDAMKWLAGNAYLDTYSDEKKIQRYALSTLYYSTKGDTWSNNNNWLDDGDECNWYSSTQWASWSGVASGSLCSSSGSVVLIDMKGNNLQGTIPQELALLSNSLGKAFLIGYPYHYSWMNHLIGQFVIFMKQTA